MSISNVKIVNMALNKIGARRIMTLDEDNEAARRANEIYEDTRDILLTKHPWNFATKRAALALVSGETPAYEFDNVFALPSDYLRVEKSEDDDTIYKIEGKRLLTNEDTINIKYIARITDPSKFSHGFVNALIYRLAADLAYAITNNVGLQKNMEDLAAFNLKVAKSEDAQEGTPDGLKANRWVLSRFDNRIQRENV